MGTVVDDLAGEGRKAAGWQIRNGPIGNTAVGKEAANRIDPGVADAAAPATPQAPDLTDDAIRKARTSMALRLQATRGRASTFNTQSPASLDLSRPVLGGPEQASLMPTEAIKWRQRKPGY